MRGLFRGMAVETDYPSPVCFLLVGQC